MLLENPAELLVDGPQPVPERLLHIEVDHAVSHVFKLVAAALDDPPAEVASARIDPERDHGRTPSEARRFRDCCDSLDSAATRKIYQAPARMESFLGAR